MFAKPRIAVTLRVLLIAVILFNALGLKMVSASSLSITSSQDTSQIKPNNNAVKTESNHYRLERYMRPTSRTGGRSDPSNQVALQTPAVLIICVPEKSTTCSALGPNVSLNETFNVYHGDTDRAGGGVTFKIQCEGTDCSKKDIYYHATVKGNYDVVWGPGYYDWWAWIKAGTSGGFGTGVILDPNGWNCGKLSRKGECTIETSGVIRKEIMSGDPNYSYFYVSGEVGGPSRSAIGIQMDIDVSLEPFGSEIPPESVNCKVCPSAYRDATGWAADPINTRTGALSYSVNDLEISTGAGPLSFRHTYISSLKDKFTSPLGYGWVHNQDIRLIFPAANEPGFVKFKDQSGNLYRFWDTGNGRYVPYAGYTATLTKNATTPVTYTLRDQAKNVYTFDETGKVKTIVNAAGQTLTYQYTNGQLSKVSYDAAHYLEFEYEPENPTRLKSVKAQPGTRSVTFSYDSNGDLDYFDDVLGQRWHYTYDTHLLTEVLDENQAPVQRNEYYPDGRAKKQFDGNNIKPTVELIYNANGTTTVKDANGIPRTHEYDVAGTLTGDLNQYGGNTDKVYNSNFRPTSIIDPDIANPEEHATTLDWSPDGANLKYLKDASGAETFIKYEDPDDPNNPTEITDPLGNKTTYAYGNAYFPTLPTEIKTVDQNGVLVGITAYDYYPPSSGAWAGKVERVTEGLVNKTHYTYTASGQPDIVITAYESSKPQTTDYDYDALDRLIKVTDPAGVITRYQYDDAGRLTVTINNVDPHNANVENPPQNSVSGNDIFNLYTRYYYDVRGNQIAVVDTDWNITRTYYDLANRPMGDHLS